MKRQVAILGGGISGLTLAWYLKKRGLSPIILEKEGRVGGWIESRKEEGFFFERGPRTLRGSSEATLQLVDEIGLKSEILWSSPAAKRRYLLFGGKLEPLPNSLRSFFSSPLMRGIKGSLLKGLLKMGSFGEDLSIDAFARERFSKEVANRLFAPMTLGIFAGDSREISLASAFPSLYRAHRRRKPLLFSLEKGSKKPLFTLKGGLEALPLRLQVLLEENIRLNSSVTAVNFDGKRYQIETSQGPIEADDLYSTLPAPTLSKFVSMPPIPHKGVTMIYLGWKENVLRYPGFGFLNSARDDLLGVVFDSAVFPEQGVGTRLTVMCQKRFLKDIERVLDILQIEQAPDYVADTVVESAIAQYPVGFDPEKIQKSIPFTILGSSFYGVGVNDVILKAKEIAC